jgi:hypothetical protein
VGSWGELRQRLSIWWTDIVEHKGKIALALTFMGLALAAVSVSSSYVDELQSVVVPDLILDVIPSVDLSPMYIWGLLVVIVVYMAFALVFRPRQFHYALMKVPAGAVAVSGAGLFSSMSYSNDLFFSGHTGIPFLGFLVYKDSPIRYFMLASSIVLASTVLLMHVHYSIDVASAYFITYGVYVLGDSLFGSPADPRVT